MSFFETLQASTRAEAQGLLTIPQLVAGLQGKISRETYVAYLTEAYHHVKHTAPLMHAAQARLGKDHDAFRAALDEYIEEETGHELWILDDIAACGADAAAAAQSEPRLATEMMVAYAYDYISRINPMGFFGMVFVLEGTSVALALTAADRIQETLGLPDKAFSYLRSHGTLDREHTQHLARLLERMTSEDQGDVLHAARVFFKLYGDVFRALPT